MVEHYDVNCLDGGICSLLVFDGMCKLEAIAEYGELYMNADHCRLLAEQLMMVAERLTEE